MASLFMSPFIGSGLPAAASGQRTPASEATV
jgi:hypothetical protein